MFLINIKESLNLFKKNPTLFLPDAISLIITYSLLAVIFFYTGASDIMPLVQSAEDVSLELLKNFFNENLLEIILSAIIFVIVTFFVGVGVTIIKYDMITDILQNKKASLKDSYFKCHPFFIPVVITRACIFIIFALSLLFTLLIGGLIYLIFSNWGTQTATIVSLAIMIPIAIIIFICLKLSLLFVYQIMFLKNKKNPFKCIKESFKIFQKETTFVIISGLVIFALSLIVSGVSNLTAQLIDILPTISVYLSPIWSVIQMILSISVSIISSIYLFLQLKTKKY